MAVEFRCDHCGKLNRQEVSTGADVVCEHCGQSTNVPEALASLPTPKVPPEQPETETEDAQETVLSGPMGAAMPLLISVLFHVGLFVVMLFVVMFAYETRIPEDVVVPYTTLSDTPSRMSDRTDKPVERSEARQPDQRRSERETPIVTGTSRGEREEQVIGIGEGADAAGAMEGLEAVAAGGGIGETEFFGTEAMAYHIVYLIDRSGSMGVLYKFESVSLEMGRSLSKLQPVQDFHIVLFSNGDPLEIPGDRLVSGTMENKRRTAVVLKDVVPETTGGQSTDPRRALERAFEVLNAAGDNRSKLIMFLTDGVFEGTTNEAVLRTIRSRNEDGRVRVNTFLYGSDDPQAVSVMRQIADENNGKYQYVPIDD